MQISAILFHRRTHISAAPRAKWLFTNISKLKSKRMPMAYEALAKRTGSSPKWTQVELA